MNVDEEKVRREAVRQVGASAHDPHQEERQLALQRYLGAELTRSTPKHAAEEQALSRERP